MLWCWGTPGDPVVYLYYIIASINLVQYLRNIFMIWNDTFIVFTGHVSGELVHVEGWSKVEGSVDRSHDI